MHAKVNSTVDLQLRVKPGGGLIVFQNSEELTCEDYFEQSKNCVYAIEDIRAMFDFTLLVDETESITEESLVNAISVGTVIPKLPLDLDALEVDAFAVASLIDVFPALSTIRLDRYKKRFVIGDRDNFNKASIMIGTCNSISISIDPSAEPRAMERLVSQENILDRYLVEFRHHDNPETLTSSKEQNILLKLVVEFLTMANIETVKLKGAGMKWPLEKSLNSIRVLNESTRLLFDLGLELPNNQWLHEFKDNHITDTLHSLVKFSYSFAETNLKRFGSRGFTNRFCTNTEPVAGWIRGNSMILDLAFMTRYQRSTFRFNNYNDKEEEVSTEPRSSIKKFVIYPAVHHWVLSVMPFAAEVEKQSGFTSLKLLDKMTHEAQATLRIMESSVVDKFLKNYIDSGIEADQVLGRLFRKFSFDSRIKFPLTNEVTVAMEEDFNFDAYKFFCSKIKIELQTRHHEKSMSKELRGLNSSFSGFQKKFSSTRVEFSLENFTVTQAVLVVLGYGKSCIKRLISNGDIQVHETGLSMTEYHLNLQILFCLFWFLSPPTLRTMLPINERSSKYTILAACLQFIDALGHNVDRGRTLLASYPLSEYFSNRRGIFRASLQGQLPKLLQLVLKNPTCPYILKKLLQTLKTRQEYLSRPEFSEADREAIGFCFRSICYAQILVDTLSVESTSSLFEKQQADYFSRADHQLFLAICCERGIGSNLYGLRKDLFLACKFCATIGVKGLQDIHSRAIIELFDSFFHKLNGRHALLRNCMKIIFPLRDFSYLYAPTKRSKNSNGPPQNANLFAIEYESVWKTVGV